MRVFRLFHTIRYLKLTQITNRLVRRFSRPRLWSGDVPSRRFPHEYWNSPPLIPARIRDPQSANFLNEIGPLYEWQNSSKSHLWLYNLHYFDDLNARDAPQRSSTHRELIGHWLKANPPAVGVGWEPYPCSLRIVNWIKWLLAGATPVQGMVESVFQQAHVLSQQLEYHLQGNHLLANAKALIFAGSFFEGEVANNWLRRGLKLLDQQHREQVLTDGGHFELSPMYHSIILTDILDLIQLERCLPSLELEQRLPELCSRAEAMAEWLRGLLHPDHNIPFFNDSVFGIAPPPAIVFEYAHRLGLAEPTPNDLIHHYDASGYVAVRQYDQVTLLDVAAIGPDYIPGHAHADTLSFEWSLFGQRVLVNSGISTYGLSGERTHQRGTSAHNTVVVNGKNSSEVWSSFRVARRARPLNVAIKQVDDAVIVSGAHDGYARLLSEVIHSREWRVSPSLLTVADSLAGKFKSAVAYFHVHPDISVSMLGDTVHMVLPGGRRCALSVEGGEMSLEESKWYPEFGIRRANLRIAVRFLTRAITTRISY